MPGRLVVISGCSGGGKSTLLEALARRGGRTVPEPGRRVVERELGTGGRALPWIDLAAFARAALEVALADLKAVGGSSADVFFDRGVVDAAAALEFATGEVVLDALEDQLAYHRRVFLAPPWPEIFVADEARRHSFEAAVGEYERLAKAYARLGFAVTDLPKAPVEARADFVLHHLDQNR